MKLRRRFFRSLGIAAFSLFFFCLLAALLLEAAESSSRVLNSDWQFRASGNVVGIACTVLPDIKQWHPAQVPGVVQTDLLHNGLIPDPFDRDNEFRLQWIGLTDWGLKSSATIDQLRGTVRVMSLTEAFAAN